MTVTELDTNSGGCILLHCYHSFQQSNIKKIFEYYFFRTPKSIVIYILCTRNVGISVPHLFSTILYFELLKSIRKIHNAEINKMQYEVTVELDGQFLKQRCQH